MNNIMSLYPDIPSQGVPFGRLGNQRFFLQLGWQWRRAAAITGDGTIIAPTRLMSRLFSLKSNVYKFRFNATDATKPGPEYAGAAHLSELNYVWNNPALKASSTDARTLVEIMSRMWVSFVGDLNPNGHGLTGVPMWETYSSNSEGEDIVFQLGSVYVEDDNWRKDGMNILIAARERVA